VRATFKGILIMGTHKKTKLVYGVGINDLDRAISKTEKVNGKRKTVWICPYYDKWASVLERCYSSKLHSKYPAYIGCTVYPEWVYLSNFIEWVDSQPNKDWQLCELDKDIVKKGNKVYSPETCAFVSKAVNNFIGDNKSPNGKYMLGVTWKQRNKKFQARCCDPFGVNTRNIGLFKTELEAHLAWKSRKHGYACMLADLELDNRVAEGLRNFYK
jgi:hypothetical protein